MKILHVVESLDRGGLEHVVIDLALAQQEGGHDVSVCCLFRLGPLAQSLASVGIQVTDARKKPGFDGRAAVFVHKEIRRSRADVLHTHNAVANYYGAFAAMLHPRLRLINTRHGMGAARGDVLKECLFRLSLLRTSNVAVVCRAAADQFVASRIVPRRLARVVHNGIRLDAFTPSTETTRTAARRALGVAEDALILGTVGRLNWAKDHALMIESFASMGRRRAQDRLVIVGGGELRADLERKVRSLGLAGAVLLLGDRDDVAALLPAFDAFVMTSATEGYSIALLEAAASGLPAVASDVGGNAEIVQHDNTGIVVGERTAESFARALDGLAAAPAVRVDMGRNARAWAETSASLARMVDSYDRLYSHASVQALSRRSAA